MAKSRHLDLTHGSIFSSLTRLALPITVTAFVQMAYNLTDMFWIGRAGADYVAAVGAAGNILWLADSLMIVARMGGQVKIGQSIGAKDISLARHFIRITLQAGMIFGAVLAIILMLFPSFFIGLYGFQSTDTVASGALYLRITASTLPAYFLGKIFTGIYSALGNTRIGLVATGIGLVTNIILDPILIFVCHMGVAGAAVATITAEIIVFVIFVLYAMRDEKLFRGLKIFRRFDSRNFRTILKVGLPAGMQSGMFALISLFIGRMVAVYGAFAVAAQKIGAQVEAISWMTADGFAVAMNAFTAQNYGANNPDRINRGYRIALFIMGGFGLTATVLLLFFPRQIMGAFLNEKDAVAVGASYLRIMGYSQLFMCVEIMTEGALAGLGITLYPGIAAMVLTWIRIPMATFLSSTALGSDGIWWSITISSILKGVILFCMFRLPHEKRLRYLR